MRDLRNCEDCKLREDATESVKWRYREKDSSQKFILETFMVILLFNEGPSCQRDQAGRVTISDVCLGIFFILLHDSFTGAFRTYMQFTF
jgi:hypothetical protein